MKLIILSIFSAAVLCVSLSANATDCEYPTKIDVPNGESASEAEMIEGQKHVKQYITAMESYLECLENEMQQEMAGMDPEAEEEAMQQRQALRDARHNAAVDEMEEVANNFNASVRAYKAAN